MGKRLRAATALTAAAGTLVLAATPALAATSYPNDYFFANGDQWALTGSAASINAPAAWCASTGAGVLVADVDTGANFNHPDLAGKLITDSRDAAFLGGTAPDKDHPTGVGQAAVTDDNGHGSMTTGIMVADTDNGQGIAAVAPDAQALIVKVLDSTGSGWTSDVEYGIEWAVDHGAQVINLSIGPGDVNLKSNDTGVPDPRSQGPIVQGIQYASQHGVAVAVASGNSNLPASSYATLLSTQAVATVGALGPGDTVASYSNYGYGVTIYAPGGDGSTQSAANWIVSTFIDKNGFIYGIGEGTSFATPQVAGTLADLIAKGDSAAQAVAAVRNSAPLSSDGFRQLDAAGALGRSKNALCGTPSTGGSVAPPGGGFVGPGGKGISAPPTSHPTARPTQAPATHTAPGAVAAASTPTPAGAGEPTGGAVATGPAGGADQGGRTSPPTGTGGTGGGANPLLIVGLGVLILGGAPLGASVVMRLRGPRLGR